jgi:pimeloyl-ACP methyl ester carboxylesterase
MMRCRGSDPDGLAPSGEGGARCPTPSTTEFASGERERTLASDAGALAAARRARLTAADLADEAVAAIRLPALLYAGTLDEPGLVERAARLMPNATFVALAGLDRARAFERSDVVLPHVQRCLAGVEATAAGRS